LARRKQILQPPSGAGEVCGRRNQQPDAATTASGGESAAQPLRISAQPYKRIGRDLGDTEKMMAIHSFIKRPSEAAQNE
jgi:hypothetical protein